jgi:rhodanese-related sulfurtransferase
MHTSLRLTFCAVFAAAMSVTLPSISAAQQNSISTAILGQPQKTAEVSTEELRRVLADGSAKVFDARPFMEFAKGHIPGAMNVAPKAGTSDVAEIERTVQGNKSAAIILYCNGPFCGKSNKVGDELAQAGFTNVRRYQLGVPVWRALGGVMQVEPEGFEYIRAGDQTARVYDARSTADAASGTMPGAISLPEVDKARDRLPSEDHNTRIVVFGSSPTQARATAEAIAKNAYHNVMFCADAFCKQQIAAK